MRNKHNIVYKITNKLNGKFYVGIHSTDDLNDGYMGSGKTLFKAIKKYGIDNFEISIMFDYDNSEDMYRMESLLVDNITINQADCYNEKPGGEGGSELGRKLSEKTRRKMSETKKKSNPFWDPFYWKGKTGSQHHKSKRVKQIDIDTGEVIAIHESIREAERITGIENSNISKVCVGKKYCKSAGGYMWEHV